MLDQLKMMKQARDMQKKMKQMEFTTEYQGITITMNGKQDIIDLKIPEDLMENADNLSNRLKQAFNNAIADSQKQMAEQMRGEMGGMLGM